MLEQTPGEAGFARHDDTLPQSTCSGGGGRAPVDGPRCWPCGEGQIFLGASAAAAFELSDSGFGGRFLRPPGLGNQRRARRRRILRIRAFHRYKQLAEKHGADSGKVPEGNTGLDLYDIECGQADQNMPDGTYAESGAENEVANVLDVTCDAKVPEGNTGPDLHDAECWQPEPDGMI